MVTTVSWLPWLQNDTTGSPIHNFIQIRSPYWLLYNPMGDKLVFIDSSKFLGFKVTQRSVCSADEVVAT